MYMGADKFENEDLIKYGLPEDMWFHVDDMSSAHVYLRLRRNQKLEDVSRETIMECAQLVKANSIEGCKLREVKVGELISDFVLSIFLEQKISKQILVINSLYKVEKSAKNQ